MVYLSLNIEDFIGFKYSGAILDAILDQEDEDGDEWQDEHVQRVHTLAEPCAQVYL